MADHRSLADTKKSLPPPCPTLLLDSIREKSEKLNRSIVVLDDDPTGTQTVYDVPVLTEWSVETVTKEFENQTPLFFILTNSRSVSESNAIDIATQIGSVLVQASNTTGREFEVISRSDSTLRGHYPAEVDALADSIGRADCPQIFCCFFSEGHRLTVDDVHYVVEGDEMIPAAETPFAKDTAFGYTNSNLKLWIEEKTKGKISSDAVASVSVARLREDLDAVKQTLGQLASNEVCIVNCLELGDLLLFVDALLDCCLDGKSFIYRTAASFVQIRAGLATRQLLTTHELRGDTTTGGLIVVGSYVPKTTKQLQFLHDNASDLVPIELEVEALIADSKRDAAVADAKSQVNSAIESGKNVVLYTSRDFVSSGAVKTDLALGQRVSFAIVEIVSALTTQPAFLVAKGGITSSDVATKGLGVKRAKVIGQILPGVPVWKLSDESRFPGMAYVVFPGNVGDDGALFEAYEKLSRIEHYG